MPYNVQGCDDVGDVMMSHNVIFEYLLLFEDVMKSRHVMITGDIGMFIKCQTEMMNYDD